MCVCHSQLAWCNNIDRWLIQTALRLCPIHYIQSYTHTHTQTNINKKKTHKNSPNSKKQSSQVTWETKSSHLCFWTTVSNLWIWMQTVFLWKPLCKIWKESSGRSFKMQTESWNTKSLMSLSEEQKRWGVRPDCCRAKNTSHTFQAPNITGKNIMVINWMQLNKQNVYDIFLQALFCFTKM